MSNAKRYEELFVQDFGTHDYRLIKFSYTVPHKHLPLPCREGYHDIENVGGVTVKVTQGLKDGKVMELKRGEKIRIPHGIYHSMEAIGGVAYVGVMSVPPLDPDNLEGIPYKNGKLEAALQEHAGKLN